MTLVRAAFALLLVALAAAIGAGAWTLSGWIEARTAARAAAALEDQAWAQVAVDGVRMTVSGEAPGEGARLSAIDALTALGGVTRLDDRIAVVEPPVAPPPRPAEVVALRDAKGVTLTGVAPPGPDGGPRDLAPWRAALGEGAEVTDGVLEAAPPATHAWTAARDFAARALAPLAAGRAEITPGHVRLETAAETPDAAEALAARLRADLPDGVTLELDVAAPPPAFSPFRFIAALSPAGATLVACDAQSEDEAEALRAAFARLPAHDDAARTPCRVGLGAPSAEWGLAAQAGLAALATLDAGRFELIDTEARLVGLAPSDPGRFEAAAQALGAALGETYSLRAEAPPSAGPARASGSAAPALWAEIVRGPEGVSLAGAAPDETTRLAVTSYARALFGAGAVSDGFSLGAAPAPDGWRRAALAGLDALAALDAGTVRYDGRTLKVEGVTEDAAAVPAVREALAAAPAGAASRVTVDLPALAARLPIPPGDCLAHLAAIVAQDPIRFAPASAEIEGASGATLDRLAASMRRCAGIVITIEGHTDSQGLESTNLALSQDRADAVRQAMRARGVPADRMRAAGFGESRPVADNGTEAGRARNRRIAFAAAEGGAPTEQETR